MPLLRRLIPQHALPLLVFLIASVWQLYMQGPFSDPDTGWHIAAGEWIVTHRALPEHDPWSYTAGDAPWYNLAWAFDVLLYALYALGGLTLIYFLTVFSYSVMAMLLARDALKRGASPIVIIGFFIVIAGPLIMQSALCRPHMVSAFLFYASLRILARDRDDPSFQRMLWLPLIMVLWVNMHGGFILLAVLFAAHLTEALALDDRARIRRLVTIGIITGLAILINPYGWHIYDAVMRTLDSVMTPYIAEWRGVNFSVQWWFDMAILACVFGLRPTERAIPFSEKALVLAMLLLSLHSARHGLMLAIAATPFLCMSLTQMLYALRNGEHHHAQDRIFQSILTDKRMSRGVAAGVAALIAVMLLPTGREWIAPHADELAQGKTPVKALRYIKDHYAKKMHWFNEYSLGGPLIFYGKGHLPVFIDGRAGTAYPEPVLKEYLRVMETGVYGTRARAILRKHEADGLIIPAQHRVNVHLKNNPLWKRVYKDEAVMLYVRKLKAD